MFLSSFPKEYVGKEFEIDCVDIEIRGSEDFTPSIFKGSGIIRGDKNGRLRFKVYNQLQVDKKMFDYLKLLKESNDPNEKICRLKILAYDGTEWSGGWTIPEVILYQSPYLKIEGELDQLTTRVTKLKGDTTRNTTELVFSEYPDLPFTGSIKVQRIRGDEVISTSYGKDHHEVKFEDTIILFRESFDKSRLHIEAGNTDGFTPPFVETWIMEALIFVTARMLHPRMVIRHFEKDALVILKSTPQNVLSGMLPPFSRTPETEDAFWHAFCAYLSKCKETQQFELLELTRGFYELCLASKGTLQGFLISLSLYIEYCINLMFSSSKSGSKEDNEYKMKVKNLIQYVDEWNLDDDIRNRAKGLLTMLNTPSLSKQMDILIEQKVITKTHKKVWQNARPYLAHGNIIDFTKEEEFWHIRNYLISMVYRLMFKIIGYRGIVTDYNGKEFNYCIYEWRE
ncbi:hypothetical protein [Dendrosporobacter sp. 1207_IL3150]|uniref:hypothetical protein n=1 Tax=Dendrosporobacter sp. 1207_IL3150 TaxID=3084054 RepID=UPI002FD98C7B